MAETAEAIIKFSLRQLKVLAAGEPLKAAEGEDGLVAMNEILDSWSLQGYAQTNKVQLSQTLTPSTSTYTFGTGGDNSTRPVRVTSAWVRDASNNDYPLEILSNDQYSDIWQKTLATSYPAYVYFREEYPLMVANLYPVPDTAYTLYLEAWATIGSIASVSTSVDLAPGYIEALKYALAVKMAPEYKLHESFPLVQQQADKTLARIKRVNTSDRPKMKTGLNRLIHGRNNDFRSLFP